MPPSYRGRSAHASRYRPYPRPAAEGFPRGDSDGRLGEGWLGHSSLEASSGGDSAAVLPLVNGEAHEQQVRQPTYANVNVAVAFVRMMRALRRQYWALLAAIEFLRARKVNPE